MLRNLFFAVLAVVGLASASHAAVMGSFRLLEEDKDTNDLIYPGLFDTYVFELETMDGIVDALELNFMGNFLQTSGSTTFKQGASNPILFGSEAPETFFVLPPGAAQLAADVADTATQLRAAWTTEGALPIVPADGTVTPVAFFSLAADSPAPTFEGNVLRALALIGGIENTIVPRGMIENTPPVGVDAEINDQLAAAGIVLTHPFQATDTEDPTGPFTWSNLDFVGAAGHMGTGVPFFQPTLSSEGLFSWDTQGSARGIYTATATVADPDGATDTAVLTINVTRVPEPATLGLFGLAMVGLVGLIRRRG